MALYRFNILGQDGKPTDHHDNECASDLHALQRALDLRNGYLIEVWQAKRWVAAVGKHPDSYAMPGSAKAAARDSGTVD